MGLTGNSVSRFAVDADDQVLKADSAQATGVKWDVAIPVGLIMMIASGSCPTGWTEYTATRGRALVGVPSGGTVGGTVGTALTNLQDKTHTHTNPVHSHAINRNIAKTGGLAWRTPANTDNNTGVASGTSAASASLPYIQLRFCQKD